MNNLYPFVNTETIDPVTVEWFYPKDILMISSDKKGGAIHYIGAETYKCMHLTLEAYEEIWYSGGFRFTDRCCVTNLSKVKFYNDDLGLLYFEDNPTKHSLSAPVARMRRDVVMAVKEQYGIVFLSDTKDNNKKSIGLTKSFSY